MYEGDACCPTCVEDWLSADPAEYLDVPQATNLVITCTSLVKPRIVDWFFSADNGTTWTEIVRSVNRLVYTIKDITSDDDGERKISILRFYL